MAFYEDLVTQTQMNFERYYGVYASGGTPYQLTDKKPLPYHEQITRLTQEIRDADCIVVGGASGLSAAGGGDFYYEDNASFRKYFGKFAEKYNSKGPLMECSANGMTGQPFGHTLPPSCTPPRPPRCGRPISIWMLC